MKYEPSKGYIFNDDEFLAVERVCDLLTVLSATYSLNNDPLEEALNNSLGFMADMLKEATRNKKGAES